MGSDWIGLDMDDSDGGLGIGRVERQKETSKDGEGRVEITYMQTLQKNDNER